MDGIWVCNLWRSLSSLSGLICRSHTLLSWSDFYISHHSSAHKHKSSNTCTRCEKTQMQVAINTPKVRAFKQLWDAAWMWKLLRTTLQSSFTCSHSAVPYSLWWKAGASAHLNQVALTTFAHVGNYACRLSEHANTQDFFVINFKISKII